MREKKFEEFIKQTLENKYIGGVVMKLVEMTVDEAMRLCGGQAKVLVAVQNLEEEDINVRFAQKQKEEYEQIFSDVETVASLCDDFVKQLRCFTAKQDIRNIRPVGVQKIVLLK